MTELLIEGVKGVFMPVLCDEITLYTERYNMSTLKFKTLKEGSIDFKEGNTVRLCVDGKKLFLGYVFSKSRTSEGIISVTCHDQLRYLKNKDTYTYSGKRADEVVRMICDDYRLKTGTIDNTGFVLPPRIEDNTTLFDIIYTALSLTKLHTGKDFLLYDDFGSITLRNRESMTTSLLIDNESALDFRYSTTIDRGVYNKIKLLHKKDTKYIHIHNEYTAEDPEGIAEWGILQRYAHIDEHTDGNTTASNLLRLYRTKNRHLDITAFGDLYIRAGSEVYVRLDIGDFIVDEMMEVYSCKHIFRDKEHIMVLEVRGGVLDE